MNEIDNLLCDLFEIRNSKHSVIKKQKYEKAAELRDSERQLEVKIYKILYSEELYDWEKLSEGISKYCFDTYGFIYDNKDYDSNFRETIREIKLKQLGIK